VINIIKYYIKRLKPIFIFFMITETLLRVFLAVKEYRNLQGDWNEIFRTLLTGMAFDISVFAYFIIPIFLYLLLLPAYKHVTKRDKKISSWIYFIIIYLVLFTSLSEWIFWDEFSTRFNFIAVDYLVYTHEVLGNIWESYPIIWLLSALGVISFIITLFLTRGILAIDITKQPKIQQRLGVFALSILIAVLSFNFVSNNIANFGANRYWQEIAKNGYFEIFSAFRNNNLSYDKFYKKIDDEKALKIVRNSITETNSEFIDKGITRYIKATRKEKKYNIMLITVESLSAAFMKSFGYNGYEGHQLTPNLDKLAKKSLFFTNLKAIGTRTVYGLSAINLSIPPVPGNAIIRQDNNENLFSLASVLNKKSYESKFIYGGYGYFDNMNYFFENNGYKIVDRNNLTDNEITFENIWGVCDEDLFNKTIKEADKSFKKGKRFFNMIMTTSNHRPYSYPKGKIDDSFLFMGKRAGGVLYTDYAINKFINHSKKKPWFNNTIFVIIADHTAGTAGRVALPPAKYNIPLLIYAPKIIKPAVIDKLVSQIDVAPTLLGLMNMSYKSRFYGVDIMKTSPKRAYIANYQNLGYLTKDSLTVMSPIKKITSYKRNGNKLTKQGKGNKNLIKKTIGVFQTASKWLKLNKSIDSVN